MSRQRTGGTQLGNNNAYCQDDELSWFDCQLDDRRRSLLDYTTRLIAFRRAHPNFHRRKFFEERNIRHEEAQNVVWLRFDGQEMTDDDWNQSLMKSLGLFIKGQTIGDEGGEPVRNDSFLLLFNCHVDAVEVTFPAVHRGRTGKSSKRRARWSTKASFLRPATNERSNAEH